MRALPVTRRPESWSVVTLVAAAIRDDVYRAGPMGAHDYRAFSVRLTPLKADSLVHLVREDAEASLCGIPRSALGPALVDEYVCSECVEWLARRRAVSGQHARVEKTQQQ
jgi:hypothetical protein